MMASSETRDTIESRGNVDVTAIENAFKKDKSRAKSNFTRSRNRLLMLIKEHDLPSHLDVNEACKKLESCFEIVMDILANFSDFYTKQKKKQTPKCKHIVGEMGQIEEDFYTASGSARECLKSRKDDSSSLSLAEMLKIDLRRGLNIADNS